MIGAKVNMQSVLNTKSNVEAVLDQIERRGMKDALMKAGTPMAKRTKGLAPRRTGALRASIGKKGKTYRKTNTAYVVIGPRSGFVRNGEKPAHYAPLVEFGHQRVVGGKRVGFVSPKPFMRPAFEGSKGESLAIYRDEIGNAIHRHFRRAKKGGRL